MHDNDPRPEAETATGTQQPTAPDDRRPFEVNDDDAVVDAGSPQDYGDPNDDLVSPNE
jgi:hypothetical protein